MKSRFKIFKTDKLETTGTIWIDIDLIDYHNKRLEFEFKENDKKLKDLLQSTGWDWVPDYPQAELNLGLCEFDPEFKEVNFIENNYDQLLKKAYRDLFETLSNEFNGDIGNVHIDFETREKVALEQLTPQEGAKSILKKFDDEILDLNIEVDNLAKAIFHYGSVTNEFPDLRDLEDGDDKLSGMDDLIEIKDKLFDVCELLVDYVRNYGETD